MLRSKYFAAYLVAIIILLIAISSCGLPSSGGKETSRKLHVVATTTIVGDIVKVVGGEQIDLTVLLPVGSDPHGYQATPRDLARVADADVVFLNGAGLEGFIDRLVQNAGGNARFVYVSEGIQLQDFGGSTGHSSEGENHAGDPHVWTDPNNVKIWVKNIERGLSEIDPGNSSIYKANAEAYQLKLEELDGWVREQVAKVPAENRKLVTDHKVLGYFAVRYGFEQIGAILPGYSTLAEPSAQELAVLEDTIRSLGVKAIFVGNTVNPQVAQQIAEDTKTRLAFFYTESLSETGASADNYLDYIKYNVNVIVSMLK